MAASPLKAYISRSLGVARQTTSKILAAQPIHNREPHLIYSIDSSTALSDFATGADSDIGGMSTCTLDKDDHGDGRFWGEMKLGVQKEYEGKVRGGYVGFRNKSLPTLFGSIHHDLSPYSHLAVTVRPSGDPQTLRHWFVNIQTDGPVSSDLFQHRLPLPPTPLHTQWITLHLPISSFVLTNSGVISETQIPMMIDKIRTVGFSLLGGGREPLPDGDGGISVPVGVEGRFELGVRRVEAVFKDQARNEFVRSKRATTQLEESSRTLE